MATHHAHRSGSGRATLWDRGAEDRKPETEYRGLNIEHFGSVILRLGLSSLYMIRHSVVHQLRGGVPTARTRLYSPLYTLQYGLFSPQSQPVKGGNDS